MPESECLIEVTRRFAFDHDARKLYVNVGKVEIGQHIHTAFRKIVADALEVNIAYVRVSPVNTQYSPDDGMTVGSLSVQVTGAALRNAALSLRSILIEQAAHRLKSDAKNIAFDADNFELYTAARSCPVFELQLATDLSAAKRNSICGSLDSVDSTSTIAASILGERRYIQDLVLPDMRYARALRRRLINSHSLENVRVIRNGGFCALIAETEAALEHAWSGLETASTTRDTTCDGPIQNWIHKRQALTETIGDTSPLTGSVSQRVTRGFLLHASIAPSCAIASFDQGVLEVWTHSQGLFPLRDTLARHLGIQTDNIILHHVPSAGCYGHSAADDAVLDAVLVCLQTEGSPVRVTWTRQDDFQHAPLGAPMHVQIDATLRQDNAIADWRQTIWSGPHGQRPGSGGNINLLAAMEQNTQHKSTVTPDLPIALGGGATRNATPPYSIESFGVTSHLVQDLPVRTSSIRGLGAQMNVVCIEATMDKLADSCAVDRLEFRLRHLTDPRARKVLHVLKNTLEPAEPALQDDEATGIAYSRYKGKAAYAAVAVKIRLTERVELLDVWAVVDAGHIVDESGALNQIEGGVIQAVSWTLNEGVLLRDGFPDAAGWENYPIIGWSGIPDIHTTLVESHSEFPSLGVGECMVGPVSAAIVNAVSAAVGCSMADLPLIPEKFIRAASTND